MHRWIVYLWSPFPASCRWQWNAEARSRFLSEEGYDENVSRSFGTGGYGCGGDMPRDIQEALFETAMKGQDAEREELARLLHDRHPRTLHPPRRNLEGERSA